MKTALMIVFMFLGQTYNIELAVTPTEKATGLMFRKQWTEQGMLFIFDQPNQASFWMKNTYLDLVMIYLNDKMDICEVHYPVPLSNKSIVSKKHNIKYVLELNPKLKNDVLNNWPQFKVKLLEQLSEKETQIKRLQNINSLTI
ncbi:MAG: DUF192 domain-containing protein [Brevinemataceae bacterium]